MLVKQVKPGEGELFIPKKWSFRISSHFCKSVTPRCLGIFCLPANLQKQEIPLVSFELPIPLGNMSSPSANYAVTGLWVIHFCSLQCQGETLASSPGGWNNFLRTGTKVKGFGSQSAFFLIQNRIFRWVVHTNMTSVRVNILYR